MAANSRSPQSSILIVGAGIFGTSTAYHLSQLHPGPSITIIDRTPFPPTPAASTDINKIIRADYTSPFYMALATEALRAWSTWPELKPFYHQTGWVVLDEDGSDVAKQIREAFRERKEGDPTSDVALAEVQQRWGGVLREVDLDGHQSAYWNPETGWCEAAGAVAAMMKAAVARGVQYVVGDVAEVVVGEKVDGVKLADGRVFSADKVLLCTGAWTSELLSPVEDKLSMKEEDRVERQAKAAAVCVAHYKLTDEEAGELQGMPILVYGDIGEVLPPSPENILKFNGNTFTNHITTPSGHRISVPPKTDQTVVPTSVQQDTFDAIVSRTMLRYTKRPALYWRLCWDSVAPSRDQLITKHPHPALSNLYLGVAGSFQSWKFLPTIGRYVVNVLNGRSNGEEHDRAWKWKTDADGGTGEHQRAEPQRDLADVESDPSTFSPKARL